MKHIILILLGVFAANTGATQALKQYRSTANPYYWKNRLPDAAYWQQDVYYKIDARIDETTHIIHGTQQLEYWNNAPDTLKYVYFHLYQNAFVKGSHLHALEEAQYIKPRLGQYEAAGLGTEVENIRVDGEAAATEMDNTILKVHLPKPLAPGNFIVFTMDFRTYFDRGGTRRRMQMWDAWSFTHYNGVQWYPKISVYDRKFGWDTHQHMNKEFYGEFGVFDVSLDFAANYVAEATGVLQNRDEVLPPALREKLDIKNFADKPWGEPPSIVTPYEKGVRKTWRYLAENVHDFAFTADPSYRIGTTYWNGIECVGLVQEPHASRWQQSAELVADIIRTFSKDIGMYAYPKMVAADARDGMEYPMLILGGGAEPGYRGLLVHEIAHNWFYGMVGSNETYRAALDEGLTQFLTAWGLDKIDGEYIKVNPPESWYRKLFHEPVQSKDARVFNRYLRTAISGKELPLNTHSDDFHNALGHGGGYGMVYYKTATMLYNLQYTLGDSLFQAALQYYFEQWKMAHPYFEDFRNSIIQFTGVDLNWFFDQWLETTKNIDYKIRRIRKIPGTDSFAVTFKRKGQMQMPVDFTITENKGTTQHFHIPNTWFTKQTEASVLPKWYGWGKLHHTYTARIRAPKGIRSITIDTSERLADIYPLDNNKTRWMPIRPASFRISADGGMHRPDDRRHYRILLRPDAWWNPVDGIKAGIHLESNYLGLLHRVEASFWWNTHFLQADRFLSFQSEGWYAYYLPYNFSFRYQSPLFRHYPEHGTALSLRFIDGLVHIRAGYEWKPNDNLEATVYYQSMWRPVSYDLDYLMYPNEWSSLKNKKNNSLSLTVTRHFRTMHGNGSGTFSFRAPFMGGNHVDAFDYSFSEFTGLFTTRIDKLSLRTRFFTRIGTGTRIPYESALWLAGASPESMMDNKYVRTIGFVPDEWSGISRHETNHFHMGGGLNLRGYAGYLIADERNGEILIGYKGRSGAAINMELDVDGYIPLKPRLTRNWLHLDAYLFADAGLIELNRINNVDAYYHTIPTGIWSNIRIDAGLGLALTIKKWGVFEKAKPLTIRFDMPLLLNRPPHTNPQYNSFRYVAGINRTF